MFQNTLILCAIIGFIAWYYFNKFQESEKEYCKMHRKYEEVVNENARIKSRIKDLQSYKDDVSKTFKILDNELLMINDHIKQRNNGSSPATTSNERRLQDNHTLNGTQGNRVSILTPELLGTLFNNMNQERQSHERFTDDNYRNDSIDEQETQPVLASLTYEVQLNGSPYERYLLDTSSMRSHGQD